MKNSSMGNKAKTATKIFLFLVYIVELSSIFAAWKIYTSLYNWVPWHEPCGMQILVNYIFFIPLLIIIGLILLSLKNKIGIPRQNLWLPWFAVLAIGLPTINGGLSTYQVMTGSILVLFVLLLSFYLNVKHILAIVRK